MSSRILSQLSNKQLIWIIIAVLVAVLPQVYRLPIWFLPMTIAVVAYRLYSQIKQIKKTYTVVLSMLAIMVLILLIYSQGFGISREISVSILITMTVLKLLETYRLRDAHLVVVLCYFVIMTRFLYSQDILLTLFLLGSVFTTTHALSILQHQNSEKIIERKQLKSTAGILFSSLPFAVLFFLLFPRLGAPIWGSPDIFGEGKSGISDTMSPGSIVNLFMDDSPAFRATFDKQQYPPKDQLYWRGPVLWHYDGVTWSRNKDTSFAPLFNRNNPTAVSYQIEQEPSGQNYLFGLDRLIQNTQDAMLMDDFTLYAKNKVNQLKTYRLKSIVGDSFAQKLSPKQRSALLQFPTQLNPKTQVMMRQWRQQAEQQNRPQSSIVNQALRFFNQQGFFYSYEPPPLSGDIIDQFLFQSKRGFCEHYASTFVIMMRMAGIPARVVTGYQGGVNMGEYLLIKQSDAHAWAEVFLDNGSAQGRWHRIDPTTMVSPERLQQGSQSIIEQPRTWHDFEWLRKIRENFDTYRYGWNRWVRNFNHNKQQALFKTIGFIQRDGKQIALLMAAVIFITGGILSLVLWLKNRPRHNPHQKLRLQYTALFHQQPKVATERQGFLELNRQFKANNPQLTTLIDRFESHYLQSRFAKNQTKLNQLQQLIAQIKRRQPNKLKPETKPK